METIARLAVPLSCAAAGGTLLVVLAGPRSAGPLVREAHPGSLPGVLPPALAGYVFLAAGVALTRSPVESTPASSVCGRAARSRW